MISQTTRVKAHERKLQALELRKKRASYREIGRVLGVSAQAAWKLVNKALIETIQDPADDVRRIELESLDQLEMRLWQNAADPAVVDRILKIKETRAKYLGLYAPTRTEQSGPNGQPIRIERIFDHESVIASIAPRSAPDFEESGDD
jgi:hypothetical protein